MSKIRAYIRTYAEYHVNDEGLIDEFAAGGFDVDQIDLEYYYCSDCNEEFNNWAEAKKHTDKVCPEYQAILEANR